MFNFSGLDMLMVFEKIHKSTEAIKKKQNKSMKSLILAPFLLICKLLKYLVQNNKRAEIHIFAWHSCFIDAGDI